MEPNITITSEENNSLFFTISNINHSLANSLRRIILSDIPTVIFRTFPHNESKVDIIENTSRLNNEILKQRIGCIPIHITDTEFPYQDYVVELDKKNTSDTIELVTTEDFKIKNIATNNYLSDTNVKELFPSDLITNDFIPITRLRPKLSENVEGEQIQFNAYFDIGTAKQDGMYNVVSTCAYGNTVDSVKANDTWNEKKADLVKQGLSEEDIEFQKKNWFLLEGKRITTPNSFDFTIESVGVYSNFAIVNKACDIMIQKCKLFTSLIEKGEISIEKTENTTINNEYTVTLKNEDYTLGKALEYFIYQKYFLGTKSVSFVGFRVPHPHIPNGIIRIAFDNDNDDSTTVSQYLTFAAENVITTFVNIQSKFKH